MLSIPHLKEWAFRTNLVTGIKFYVKTNKPKISNKVSSKFADAASEVSATIMEPQENNSLKKVMNIISEHNITKLEAKKIYDSSKGNLDIIYKVYQDKRDKQAEGIVGLMISLVKPGVYIEPKKNCAKGSFNDYEQREYDFDELEKQLLNGPDDKDIEKIYKQKNLGKYLSLVLYRK